MTAINATLERFGHPATLVRDYRHWCVLLRPAQATLGALVLGAKGEAKAFSALPAEAFAELATVTRHMETGLAAFRAYDRINYLMLMMVDPHVHFHVLPRFRTTQEWNGLSFPDSGWPGPPVLANPVTPDAATLNALREKIASGWPAD
jgi:diadenosine tetraphosphate (Ap4A) HIT family hydrolase